MPSNVEIKIKVEDLGRLRSRVETLADSGPDVLDQRDTFFGCRSGRLKLREFGDGSAELIAYRRPDTAGPKESAYVVAPVADVPTMTRALDAADGVLGVVRKRRWLYVVGQTRVHLDQVDGLGLFLELEVVLRDDQSVDEGAAIAEGLMRDLGLDPRDLVEGSYFDRLSSNSNSSCSGSSSSDGQ